MAALTWGEQISRDPVVSTRAFSTLEARIFHVGEDYVAPYLAIFADGATYLVGSESHMYLGQESRLPEPPKEKQVIAVPEAVADQIRRLVV